MNFKNASLTLLINHFTCTFVARVIELTFSRYNRGWISVCERIQISQLNCAMWWTLEIQRKSVAILCVLFRCAATTKVPGVHVDGWHPGQTWHFEPPVSIVRAITSVLNETCMHSVESSASIILKLMTEYALVTRKTVQIIVMNPEENFLYDIK